MSSSIDRAEVGNNGGVVRRRAQFSMVPTSIYNSEYLGGVEQAVYGFLDRWRESAHPSMKAIKRGLDRKAKGNIKAKKFSIDAIREAINALEAEGYVMRVRRGVKKTNWYVLDDRGLMTEADRPKILDELGLSTTFGGGESVISGNHSESDSKLSGNKEPGNNSEQVLNSEETRTSEGEPSDELPEENLCKGMADEIEKMTGKRPKITAKWINDMRLLLEYGPTDWDSKVKVPRGEVASMIRWVYRDEFWRKNVLSPAKLRLQWTKLLLAKGDDSPTVDNAASWSAVYRDPTENRPKPQEFPKPDEFKPDLSKAEVSKWVADIQAQMVQPLGTVDKGV